MTADFRKACELRINPDNGGPLYRIAIYGRTAIEAANDPQLLSEIMARRSVSPHEIVGPIRDLGRPNGRNIPRVKVRHVEREYA